MALLRLAHGDVGAASASIRRVASEAQGQTHRSRVLAALAEITLAAGDCKAARAAADELSAIASAVDAPLLIAVASHTRGAVLLAEGHACGALDALRTAVTIWQDIGAPYESARERALIGLACRQLGDEDTAGLELHAATAAFEALGAVPDVARIAALSDGTAVTKRLPAGLTAREAEVLRLVATGMSNHEIAVELVVSDHTVRRHIQNIFAKAALSSRAAATAYAFEHGLT
jgi:ATP/maltotriose-dependent transcriptional regulator MalT